MRLLTTLAILAAATPAAGQGPRSWTSVRSGALVRLQLADVTRFGRFLRASEDSIQLSGPCLVGNAVRCRAGEFAVPTAHIRAAAVRRNRLLRGFALGAGIGLAAGAAVGLAVGEAGEVSPRQSLLAATVLFAVPGIAIGAVAGGATKTWIPVRIGLSIQGPPGR